MARRRAAMQTEPADADRTVLNSPAEIERAALEKTLKKKGHRWSRLPFWRRGGRGLSGSRYYVGPRCEERHDGGGLGGAVRRVYDHRCLACILGVPSRWSEHLSGGGGW